MGFNNPDVPWRRMEATLSGRPMPDAVREDAPISRKRRAYQPAPIVAGRSAVRYAELHAHTSYSFLDGASGPEEMVEEAVRLGLSGLAITDHDGLYGVPRMAEAADELHLPTVFGAELSLGLDAPRTRSAQAVSARTAVVDPPGRHLLVLARDPDGYASLCRAISLAHLRGGVKGHPAYDLDELADLAAGRWLILTGCRKGPVRAALEDGPLGTFALDPARRALADLVDRFGRDNVVVELAYATDPLGDERYDALAALADESRLPLVATTGAHYHSPDKTQLAATLAAIRARRPVAEMAGWLPAWGSQMLRDPDEMAERFACYPQAVTTAAELAAECAFPLKLVAPDLPPFPFPAGFRDEMDYLRHLTADGMTDRYGPRSAANEAAYRQAEYELQLIGDEKFPGYFLIVWELTQFCASRRILCQGRGSAANSVVCYALKITAVDPIKYELLFERFLSKERGEPPDIDIDIESGRREEVIQHVYEMHGRHRSAQVANVITYRSKSAIRDVARVLGYGAGQQDAWSRSGEHSRWALPVPPDANTAPKATAHAAADTGTAPDADAIPELVADLAAQIADMPRHLGIHSGGMVLCDRPVIEVCPVEPARMAGRTVLQWDKDDCAYAGLVKFDLLGLGMLSALRYTFDAIEGWDGTVLNLYDIPPDDSEVYDMLCEGDTVGVFQIESRAQMATLPRLRPRKFYDLVIEIALIRPGPIQGGAVHPYLRRRDRLEDITYPHPSLEPILGRTLGIPLFQEQLMSVAIHAAGFSAGEADQLRRAMGNKRSHAQMAALRDRLYAGMAVNGITADAADRIYAQIEAFASYGFPESHAVSFAYLASASAWLKLHRPAAFLAGLLRAQPMGFYSSQSLVHDARRHGVTVHPVDLNRSGAQATLESQAASSRPAVRLGLSDVHGIDKDLAEQITTSRQTDGPYVSLADLTGRVPLTTDQVEALATAGAFGCLGLTRRQALWGAAAATLRQPHHLDIAPEASAPALPDMTATEQLIADLWSTGISGDYPTALVREQLNRDGVHTAAALRTMPDRTRVTVGGVVTHRQRPPTAGGIIFLSLEDETGLLNVVVPPGVFLRARRVVLESGALLIRGTLERSGVTVGGVGGAINVVAEHVEKLYVVNRNRSRDFR